MQFANIILNQTVGHEGLTFGAVPNSLIWSEQ